MRQSTLIKLAVGLLAIAVFGVLFIRSVRNVGAQPYTLRRATLAGWTVALDPAPATSGVRLALWPPGTFAAPLFSQLFTRSGLMPGRERGQVSPVINLADDDRAIDIAIQKIHQHLGTHPGQEMPAPIRPGQPLGNTNPGAGLIVAGCIARLAGSAAGRAGFRQATGQGRRTALPWELDADAMIPIGG